MIFKSKKSSDTVKAVVRIDGAKIKYVTRSEDGGTARIAGRSGGVCSTGDKLVLLCEGKVVFSSRNGDYNVSELMSGDGAVISGLDEVTGKNVTVTAYFSSPVKR